MLSQCSIMMCHARNVQELYSCIGPCTDTTIPVLEDVLASSDLIELNILMQITLPEALLNASTIPIGTVLPVNETTLVPPNRTHILHVTFSTVLLPSGQIR